MRLRYTIVFACAALIFAAPAMAMTGFVASLSGSQEVPPNASPATGVAYVLLDNAGTTLIYHVTYSGLTASRTASHFHAAATPACPGINGGVQLAIAGAGPTSDSINGSGPVNAVLSAALNTLCSGGSVAVYVNVHSTTFPGGEIRGQLFPDTTPTHAPTWGQLKMLYR